MTKKDELCEMKTVDRGKPKQTPFTYFIIFPIQNTFRNLFLGTKRWSPETSAGSEAPPYPSPSTYGMFLNPTFPFDASHWDSSGRGSGRMENP